MALGRIALTLLFIAGVFVIGKGFFKDVQENRPPKIHFILTHDARVDAGAGTMTVTNKDGFAWPKPRFTLRGGFEYRMTKDLAPAESVVLKISDFKNDEGHTFPPDNYSYDLDIYSGTMAMRRR